MRIVLKIGLDLFICVQFCRMDSVLSCVYSSVGWVGSFRVCTVLYDGLGLFVCAQFCMMG